MALLKIVALVAALAAAVHGFTIPEGQGDGVYMAYADDDANEYHFPLDIGGINMTERAAALGERADVAARFNFPKGSYANCGGGSVVSLAQLDWTAADDQFQTACAAASGHIKTKQAVYPVSGTVVAYMCNYSSKANPCSTDEYASAKTALQQSCNQVNGTEASWYSIPAWSKSYGYQAVQGGFC